MENAVQGMKFHRVLLVLFAVGVDEMSGELVQVQRKMMRVRVRTAVLLRFECLGDGGVTDPFTNGSGQLP